MDSFNSFFSQFRKMKVITEMTKDIIQYLPEIDDNLEYIFGNNLRIVEQVDLGSKFKVPITQNLKDDFDVDFENWSVFKKKDELKKNPIKLGKALNQKKREYEKQLNVPDISDTDAGELTRRIDEIDSLLKTNDLRGQMTASMKTSKLYVVFSRVPVDVVRMSDFDWSSCHSSGGDYFQCAIADAMNNAAVAYLIDEDGYSQIKNNINDPEIFNDRTRSVGGIRPLGRMRIRKLLDSELNEQAVPSVKLYSRGNTDYRDAFTDHLKEWGLRHINPKFNWDDTLTLVGGSYQDWGFSVVDMAEGIFGKKINPPQIDSDDEEFAAGEFGLGAGWDEYGYEDDEYALDEFKEKVDSAFNDISTTETTIYYDFESSEIEADFELPPIYESINFINGSSKCFWGENGTLEVKREFDYSSYLDDDNPDDMVDDILAELTKSLGGELIFDKEAKTQKDRYNSAQILLYLIHQGHTPDSIDIAVGDLLESEDVMTLLRDKLDKRDNYNIGGKHDTIPLKEYQETYTKMLDVYKEEHKDALIKRFDNMVEYLHHDFDNMKVDHPKPIQYNPFYMVDELGSSDLKDIAKEVDTFSKFADAVRPIYLKNATPQQFERSLVRHINDNLEGYVAVKLKDVADRYYESTFVEGNTLEEWKEFVEEMTTFSRTHHPFQSLFGEFGDPFITTQSFEYVDEPFMDVVSKIAKNTWWEMVVVCFDIPQSEKHQIIKDGIKQIFDNLTPDTSLSLTLN